ncbi:MAG: TIGR04086 family membrane protein [Firmicutes bacterium]|nr:TIGR04086 family membrane protein [Bacillota bacterium]MDD4264396.1 TIGR04086 family membrane protein [Bacillota bacterium]MDD4693683.1 TIGR04086 family membrane protein [Bacillota bacterium]
MRQAYSVLWGLLVALVLYLFLSLLFGVFAYLDWFTLGRLGYDILHYLIIAIAAFIAAKKAADKGWLVGLIIALFIAVFSVMMQRSLGQPFIEQVMRSAITLAVGTIAGVFGVNI